MKMNERIAYLNAVMQSYRRLLEKIDALQDNIFEYYTNKSNEVKVDNLVYYPHEDYDSSVFVPVLSYNMQPVSVKVFAGADMSPYLVDEDIYPKNNNTWDSMLSAMSLSIKENVKGIYTALVNHPNGVPTNIDRGKLKNAIETMVIDTLTSYKDLFMEMANVLKDAYFSLKKGLDAIAKKYGVMITDDILKDIFLSGADFTTILFDGTEQGTSLSMILSEVLAGEIEDLDKFIYNFISELYNALDDNSIIDTGEITYEVIELVLGIFLEKLLPKAKEIANKYGIVTNIAIYWQFPSTNAIYVAIFPKNKYPSGLMVDVKGSIATDISSMKYMSKGKYGYISKFLQLKSSQTYIDLMEKSNLDIQEVEDAINNFLLLNKIKSIISDIIKDIDQRLKYEELEEKLSRTRRDINNLFS